MHMPRQFTALFAVALLYGCGMFQDSQRAELVPTNYSKLSGWETEDHAAAFAMFAQNCAVALARPTPYATRTGQAVGHLPAWRDVCYNAQRLGRLHGRSAKQFFERHFTPHRVRTDTDEQGLITGYYEPVLSGSYVKTHRYTEPVYGKPRTPQNPELTRADIDAGALGNRAPILLYVDDPVMLFFMHVQGSGKVRLEDGTMVSLQFAAKNGHPYHAIGKTLRDTYGLKTVSLQTIRDWLRAHPDDMRAVLHTNPSYIFFALAAGDAYPKGALGVPLTPMRSLAIDHEFAAYGVPTYLDVAINGATDHEPKRLQRMMLSQDTGSALKGPHRGDVFFGRGAGAERLAGAQNARGYVYWLLPNHE
jgi:membrane-bound lytic murein transglycosylase A